ncbi:MAG: GNAT family N-acetyltransferase, partial [Myxococcota bacterium]
MNFFSSDSYLTAFAASFFPRSEARVEQVAVEGCAFRVLCLDGARVVHDARFLDYLEPLPAAEQGQLRPVPYLRRVARGLVTVEGAAPALPREMQPAPQVRWGAFASFDAYRALVEERSRSCMATTARKARKLERGHGRLRLEQNHPDKEHALRLLFRWKGAQYRRTGLPDLFARPCSRAFLRRLVHAGAVEVATLAAGDQLVAVHVGPRLDGRFYHWLPAHDPDPLFARCSPGTVLTHALLEASFERGDHTFDFLLGGED